MCVCVCVCVYKLTIDDKTRRVKHKYFHIVIIRCFIYISILNLRYIDTVFLGPTKP